MSVTVAKTAQPKQRINVKLLRKVKKHILEEPKRFFMGDYIRKGSPGKQLGFCAEPTSVNAHNPFERKQPIAKCGTAACIAGWSCLLGMRKKELAEDVFFYDEKAGELLGIDHRQRRALFEAYRWPERFRAEYSQAETPAERARIAAERIEAFIRSKGAE